MLRLFFVPERELPTGVGFRHFGQEHLMMLTVLAVLSAGITAWGCRMKERGRIRLLRTMAEFDNYRKRTVKEKEQERASGQMDVIETILPLLDNFERAMTAIGEEDKDSAMAKGLAMIHDQFIEALKGIGLEEIEALGQPFDPNLHNAVQHVEDEATDENTIVEVYQKGYTMKGKVVRYSMVKVAN